MVTPRIFIALPLFCMFGLVQGAEDEEAHPAQSSSEFENTLKLDLNKLISGGFQDGLASGSLGASSAEDYKVALQKVLKEWNSLANEPGDAKIKYDVILQAGHYKRAKGNTGASGKEVSEQQLAAYLVKGVSDILKKDKKLKILVLSADEYNPGLKSRIFLAVHADGSVKQCSTGPSLSYQKSSSTLAMHAIGWGLSQALGYKYEQFRKDGFTVDAAHYYMYSKVDAPVMKGLLEVGEITCATMEERLIVGADGIASNVARAITFVLDSSPNDSIAKN